MPLHIKGLGPIAAALLAKRNPARLPTTEKRDLLAALSRAGVPGHAPAIAFEKTYGGLSFPDQGEPRGWQKAGAPAWLVGPVACMASFDKLPSSGKKKLVPVLRTPDDLVYFLDEAGAVWAQDMVEQSRPVTWVANARAMMTRILFSDHVFGCPAGQKAEIASAKGEEAARALKLRVIADASDDKERWWSDGKTFVVQRGSGTNAVTTIAYASKGALKELGNAAAAPPKLATRAPVTFDSVREEDPPVRVVFDTKVKMKVSAALDAFLDAKRHVQPCTMDARLGGRFAFAGEKLQGTITAIDRESPKIALRLQLTLEGTPGAKKKLTRAEIFIRDYGEPLMNVFQFDIRDAQTEAVRALWHAVLTGWRPKK
jgi:hypothetical protein